MKNVTGKGDFWMSMLIIFSLLVAAWLASLIIRFPLIIVLIGLDWILLMVISFMFRALKRKEVKRIGQRDVAFTKDLSLKLHETDNSRFDAIVFMGKPYLAIAKFKWGIGLFLLLATISYYFRSVSFPFPGSSVSGKEIAISLFALPSIFAWIALGLIISVFWLAARIPKICYKKADFYVMPDGEKGKDIEIDKVSTKAGLMMVLRTSENILLTPNELLILPKPNHDYKPINGLKPGKVLYFGEESVLPYMELEEDKIKKDIQSIKKPIIIR